MGVEGVLVRLQLGDSPLAASVDSHKDTPMRINTLQVPVSPAAGLPDVPLDVAQDLQPVRTVNSRSNLQCSLPDVVWDDGLCASLPSIDPLMADSTTRNDGLCASLPSIDPLMADSTMDAIIAAHTEAERATQYNFRRMLPDAVVTDPVKSSELSVERELPVDGFWGLQAEDVFIEPEENMKSNPQERYETTTEEQSAADIATGTNQQVTLRDSQEMSCWDFPTASHPSTLHLWDHLLVHMLLIRLRSQVNRLERASKRWLAALLVLILMFPVSAPSIAVICLTLCQFMQLQLHDS